MKFPKSRSALQRLAHAAGAVLALLFASHAFAGAAGQVYAMSNAATNEVLMFPRAAHGGLGTPDYFATGGSGSGGGLGNQGALALSDNGQWLLAVNAGSNDVSVFAADAAGLMPTDLAPSGGERPVSVAIHGNLVYVLNAGSDSLQGFRLSRKGTLTPLPDSSRPLSGSGTAAAQLGFSDDAGTLVVTEKATNKILLYPIDAEGYAGEPTMLSSPTPTPFGFAFGKRDQFFVSEADGGSPGASALSSYRLDGPAMADIVTPSAPTNQTAACWVVVTRNGRFAYTSNTADNSLSGYLIARDGSLRLLDADGRSGSTGAGPTDMALSLGSRYLYTLNAGDGTISAHRVGANGALFSLGIVDAGLPAGASGLIAR